MNLQLHQNTWCDNGSIPASITVIVQDRGNFKYSWDLLNRSMKCTYSFTLPNRNLKEIQKASNVDGKSTLFKTQKRTYCVNFLQGAL